jgi:hypothetical protein
MTIQDIVLATGKSEQSVRRAIKAGKLVASLVNGRYAIEESSISEWLGYPLDSHTERQPIAPDSQNDSQATGSDSQAIVIENEALKQKIAKLEARIIEKDRSLEDARKASEEAHERHDMIIMQMTHQPSQIMLESSEQKTKGLWWRLWHKGKDNKRS